MDYKVAMHPDIQPIIHDLNERYEVPLDRRIFNFVVSIVKLSQKFSKSPENEVIRYQLIKSATSIGANFEEAQAACSKADFKNKIFISLKEARECHYWMRLLSAINSNADNLDLKKITRESEELKKILGSIAAKINVKFKSKN